MQDSLKDKLKNLSPDQIRKLLASRNKSGEGNAKKEFEKMKRNLDGKYPLSKAQERVWFLSYLFKNTSLYNIPVAVKLYKDISLDKLKITLQQIIIKNEILRTTFHEENGTVFQKIHSEFTPSISYEDISKNHGDKNKLIEEIALKHSSKQFDLTQLPLFDTKLIKVDTKEFVLLLNLQHIVSDGWTNALLSNDLGLDHTKVAVSPEKQYSYIDFVKWEQDQLASKSYHNHIAFWKNKLSNLPSSARFPKDFYNTTESYEGGLLVYNFTEEKFHEISSFCKKNNYTSFQFFLACFAILNSIYTQEKDLIIGTPVANRNAHYFHKTYGLFFNSLPMRFHIDGRLSFYQLMQKSIEDINQYMKRQEVPFTEIIKAINPKRNLDENVLFNIHFAYQHFPKKNKEDEYALLPIDYKTSKFDINLWVEVAGDECKLSLTYKNKRISKTKVERFLKHYQNLIDAVINNPEETIYKQAVFPKNDLSIVSGTTITHSEESWLDLFYQSLEKSPNSIAVTDSNNSITYAELNERANTLSHLFKEKGVNKNDVIVLDTGRNISFVIGMLACFKSACAYLPISPDIPEERLQFIIKDSNASLLFSDKKTHTIASISSNELASSSFKNNDTNVTLKSKDTAYIIYTSGTTGKPKGVVVSHGALLNYTKGLKNKINDSSLQTFAHVSAIQADLGNTAIFLSLGFGGTLLLPSQEVLLDPLLMSNFFKKNPADVLKIVPSHLEAFSEIIKEVLPTKVLIFGGEAISDFFISTIKENSSKELRVINHYGPTETTVGVLTHELDLNNVEGQIPIGLPINNTQIYIVSKNLTVVPKGVEGEIYISGSSLANGYLNDALLTEQKFVIIDGETFYSTGDRGIINEKGEVVFLGRKDSQVKINGFRIELSEIESVLKDHKKVKSACVYLSEETGQVKRICAAIQSSATIQSNELITYLKRYFPKIFIPVFSYVEEIPLTSNGKIDYNSLKEKSVLKEQEDIEVLPRDLFEIKLLEFYKELFPNASISIEDSFFDIGGHSLLAIKLMSKINKEFNSQLVIPNLFSHSSVKELAGLLRKNTGELVTTENPIPLVEKEHLKKSIWIHPAGGNIMCYYPIATALSPVMNTFSFDYSSNKKENDTLSIEALATNYFKTLQTKEFTSNLILAGWSMGALIAHQMACLFASKNKKIPLVLLDQPALSSQKETVSYKDRLFAYLHKVHIFTNSQFDKKIIESDTVDYQGILHEFIRVQLTPEETSLENFKEFLDILVKHNEIVTQFSPTAYDGPVLLLKAKQNLMVDEDPMVYSDDLGWKEYCSDLTIMEVPGNHITMMNAENSKVVANVIEQWLKTIT
jgi:amino acid adenylation domain-containing protein